MDVRKNVDNRESDKSEPSHYENKFVRRLLGGLGRAYNGLGCSQGSEEIDSLSVDDHGSAVDGASTEETAISTFPKQEKRCQKLDLKVVLDSSQFSNFLAA